jgi:hypothetical protein
MVVPVFGLDANDDVKARHRALREGRTNNSTLRARLSDLSARFDDEYFRRRGEEARGASPFREGARGVGPRAFALSEDASQLHEAIYEAMSALMNDPNEVARVVEAALRASAPS